MVLSPSQDNVHVVLLHCGRVRGTETGSVDQAKHNLNVDNRIDRLHSITFHCAREDCRFKDLGLHTQRMNVSFNNGKEYSQST